MAKIKIQNWKEIQARIESEKDFKLLVKRDNVYDNFMLFPNMSPERKNDWEQWLFKYPGKWKPNSAIENYYMFQALDFMINDFVCLRYKPLKEKQYFSNKPIEPIEAEYLSFHPEPTPKGSLEDQTLILREGIILISNKLIELKIPFVCPKPYSQYTP